MVCLQKPDVIKINIYELEGLFKKCLQTREAQLKALKQLIRRGIPEVVLTLGKQGAILCNSKEIWYAKAPKVEVLSTLGCGDVFFAGLVFAYERFPVASEMLKHAVAMSVASTLTSTPGDFHRSRYKSFLNTIKVQQLS